MDQANKFINKEKAGWKIAQLTIKAGPKTSINIGICFLNLTELYHAPPFLL